MAARHSILVRGLVAGLLAATALAVWFLVIDLIQGRAFYTPAFVSSLLTGRETVSIDTGLIIGYTVFHYGVFLAIGVIVAWLLSKVETVPAFLLGVVLFVLLFDLIFYSSVIITGTNVVAELGWPEVLVGNLMAGIVLLGYLHLSGVVKSVTWLDVLAEHRILREGVVAGLLGAVVVALWFLIFDAIAGRVFFTPGALGSALLYGANTIGDVRVATGTVALYTIIHVAAFIIVGIIAAAFVMGAERQPPLLLGLILFFVVNEVLFIGIVAIFASWILGTLGWWNILVGNLLAALAIGAYLWGEHPVLRREVHGLREQSLERPA